MDSWSSSYQNRRTHSYRRDSTGFEAAKRRIDAIVSGKHRKSYWKAAELILAIAETYWSNSESEKGQMLIDYFQKKYNRHAAFQRELKAAIKESQGYCE